MLKQNLVPWNECGPETWGGNVHILNNFVVPDEQKPCCNAHDVCYDMMVTPVDGLTSLPELKKLYKEVNHMDWGVCDDVFKACLDKKVNAISWYNIPKKSWAAFTGKLMSSAVIEKAVDFFTKVDDKGNKVLDVGNHYWCVKKEKGDKICMYNHE